MWQVLFTSSTKKSYLKIPQKVQTIVDLLVMELETSGPIRGNWKNYGKLGKDQHHCHLKKGHPTYVICWKANSDKTIEVYYVGTRQQLGPKGPSL